MNYARDYKNDSPYVSVNTLIRPQKSRNLSVVPPAAEIQTQGQDGETGGFWPENSAHEDLVTVTGRPNTKEEAVPGQPADPPAVFATNTQPQEAHAPEAGTPEAAAPENGIQDVATQEPGTPETATMETGTPETVTPEAEAQDASVQETAIQETETQDTSTGDLAADPLLQQDDKEPEEEKKRKSDKESQPIQRKSVTAAASGADDDLESGLNTSALNTLSSSGEPLPEVLRRNMGDAMGTDFENVRIHRDGQSASLAGQLNARAFTHREGIYFNRDQYNPDTVEGRHLIAHELAHVEQQRTVPGLQYQLEVPAERDRYEQEADAVAGKAVSSPASAHPSREPHTASVTKSSSNSIQLAKGETGSSWLLDKVGGLLKNIPGYDILVLVIGRDPASGREVKRDGIAFVKAIVGLIPGGKLLFENLEKAGVISRAVAWFKDEFQALNISFNTIKSLFSQAWKALSVLDLLNPGKAFNQIKDIFLAPIRRITTFLGKAGPKLMEFSFEGALALAGAPVKAIMGILNKGKDTLGKIIKDPVGFLKNLLNAVKGGLSNFVANIVTHLQNGIGGWIFGALAKAGITMPEKLNLAGIFSVAAQILGVTWRAIRMLVVKRLGAIGEKVMGQVEKGVALVAALITKGPLALLEMARDFLAELKTLFFDTLINWVRNTIIVKAIQKLISMFNPVGAIIQAVITIYNTIQFFIERAKQIAAFVSAVFNSIAEIAGGNIGKAAAAVENALAKGVPVAVSFLANLIGLGGIAKKVQEIIKTIRKPIDKVVGKVVGFVVGKAKQIWGKIQGIGEKKEELPKNQAEHDAQVQAGLTALEGEQKKADKDKDKALTFEEAEDVAKKVKGQYPVFKSITVVDGEESWDYDYVASPKEKIKGLKKETEENLPKTNVTYGGSPESGSMWVEANPLTKIAGNTKGSEPIQSCPGWEHAQDLNQIQDIWVKGHLLNNNLHGPGVSWNLVPLTKKNNSAMAMGPEDIAKQKVIKENKVLYYKTSVSFHSGKTPIIYFPAKLEVNVGEYIENEVKNIIKYPFTQDKPPETVEGIVYNLNEIGRDLLREKFKIPEVFAKEIIDVRDNIIQRRFKNIRDLYTVMNNYYSNVLDSKTNFTKEKMESFNSYFELLNTSILIEKRLVIR
jgi:hypothetical protein